MGNTSEHILISIIMPMYNVENYVVRAIKSVLDCGLDKKDYELIVVNDGSKDGSDTEVQNLIEYNSELQKQNEAGNWHYIKQENQGLSEARNAGIKVAKGEYVFFIDSDDYIEKDSLTTLCKRIKDENLDIMRLNFRMVDEQGNEIITAKNPKQYMHFKDDVIDGETYLSKRLGIVCYAWQFIIKRELLVDCTFTKGIYFEDTDWTPRMLLKAKRVSATPEIVYNYTQRIGSIMKSVDPEKIKKLYTDRVRLIRVLTEWYNENHLKWYRTMICRIVLGIVNDKAIPQEDKLSIINELKSNSMWPLTTHHIPFPKVIRVIVLNTSPTLYLKHTVR